MSKNLGKWIANDTVTGDNIRLANEQALRSRNAANTADINLLKGNATDKAEFGVEPVYTGSITTPNSLVTQQFMQDAIAGLRDPKDAVRLSTIAALPANTPSLGPGVGKIMTADADAALTIDGVLVANGDRILVKNEGDSNDGIYVVLDLGSGGSPWILERAPDADEDAEVTQGMSIDVVEGLVNGKKRYLLTSSDPFVVDTNTPTFVEVPVLNPVVQFKEEVFTLVALDISNGYVDLANEAETQSITIYPDDGPVQRPVDDYSLSTVSLVTRVTFAGDLLAELIATDTLIVRYAHF